MSSLSLVASAALVTGATFAFFSDEETSADNTFTAGSFDLTVDYQCLFNGQSCPWFETGSGWTLSDLGPTHKFFNFSEEHSIVPGEELLAFTLIRTHGRNW
jgi:predicted ribosomally synthesized peptide with SipW-like signal peptide